MHKITWSHAIMFNRECISEIRLCTFFIFPIDSKVLSVYNVMYKDAHSIKEAQNLNIIISNTSDKPLYEQIKEQIKSAILKGELKNGEMLPSLRTFSSDLGVSILTIRRVYDELEAEGFASGKAGKGTFVLAGNSDLIEDTKRRLIEGKVIEVLEMAKKLDFSVDLIHEIIDAIKEEI